VDSSAAAIAAQGLDPAGQLPCLNTQHAQESRTKTKNEKDEATRHRQAGFTIANTLFSEAYLSTDAKHQGLILHSLSPPNGWDYIAPGQKVPNGESFDVG